MENERVLIKCKANLKYRRYPSPSKPLNNGDRAILGMNVNSMLEGELHPSLTQEVVFKGIVCEVVYGEEYTILAEEVYDDTYGVQYDIIYIGQPMDFSSLKNQKLFLSKILTNNQIEALYRDLDNPFKVIEQGDVDTLCEVSGIGEVVAERIIEKFESSIDYSKAFVELDGYGMTTNLIKKLVEKYRSPEVVVKMIKENPYLLTKVDGIGFKKADEIALRNGFEPTNPTRLLYLAQYVLEEKAENGYSWLEAFDFLDEVNTIVDDLDEDAFCEIIANNPKIFYAFDNEDGDRCIALKVNYELEQRIANEILRLRDASNDFDYGEWQKAIKKQEKEQGWNFTDEQMAGINGLIENQVVVITGFGGTGKTSTVGAIVKILQNYIISQTALSGRAASRMSEISGEEGYTIHRLLGFNPAKGFTYNKKDPLPSDVVILDEVSMVGGSIYYSLIQAIKTGSKLIMLGDTGQLESIGKMNILNDLIASGTIPCYHLTKPHRQALKSGIIESSMKIRNKEQLFDKSYDDVFTMGELQDCHFDITQNKSIIPNMVADYFEDLIQTNSIEDVQVIVPNNDRGQLSCSNLNPILQDIYNSKSKNRIKVGDYEIRVGDKVINRKNNYKTKNDYGVITPIFNGDMGIVKSIDVDTRSIMVLFDTKGLVRITSKNLIFIKLGYCITTHSSQGSQFDHVIYALDCGAYTLLNKEQVYTGITRAKRSCTVCTENKAFRKAISTSEINKKQTFLKDILKGFVYSIN